MALRRKADPRRAKKTCESIHLVNQETFTEQAQCQPGAPRLKFFGVHSKMEKMCTAISRGHCHADPNVRIMAVPPNIESPTGCF